MPAVDLVVIGGGITGTGVFRRACAQGLSVVLLEKGGPGGVTTKASSGLLHGGLRYLPYDAPTSARSGREAGELAENYPSLARRQPFLWPVYEGHPRSLDTVESLLELYDRFAPQRRGFEHLRLDRAQALAVEPGLRPEGLVGALAFDEWAVDAVGLVRALVAEGEAASGRAFFGCKVTRLGASGGAVRGVTYERDGEHAIDARCVVNAAGPWTQSVAALAGCRRPRLSLRRGAHWVVPGAPARCALIFPDAAGRYVGLYPRPGEAWIGPSDEPCAGPPDAAAATAPELERLREAARAVLPGLPREGRAVVGVRPVLRQLLPGPLSRDFEVLDHAEEGVEGLVSVTGGKLTLFRVMAERTIELVLAKLGRPAPARAAARSWLDGAAAHNRLLCLAGSAACLAAYRLRHALRSARSGADSAALFAERYGRP